MTKSNISEKHLRGIICGPQALCHSHCLASTTSLLPNSCRLVPAPKALLLQSMLLRTMPQSLSKMLPVELSFKTIAVCILFCTPPYIRHQPQCLAESRQHPMIKIGRFSKLGVFLNHIGLRVRNEAGQRQTEFCQENTLVIANTLVQQYKRRLYTWTSPDSQHRIRSIIFFADKDGEALYSHQKQDQEKTVA